MKCLRTFQPAPFPAKINTNIGKLVSPRGQGVKIPLKEFEKNVVYDITLDTYKTFDTRICVVEHNNKLEIREPEPSETTCK